MSDTPGVRTQATRQVDAPTSFSYAAIWERVAEAFPDRPAVIWGDRTVTWGELDDRANRLAQVLWVAGLRPGARVGLCMRNRPEYVEGFFAAWKASMVPFNINYRYVASELAYLLDNADAEAVLVSPEFRTAVDEHARALPR